METIMRNTSSDLMFQTLYITFVDRGWGLWGSRKPRSRDYGWTV